MILPFLLQFSPHICPTLSVWHDDGGNDNDNQDDKYADTDKWQYYKNICDHGIGVKWSSFDLATEMCVKLDVENDMWVNVISKWVKTLLLFSSGLFRNPITNSHYTADVASAHWCGSCKLLVKSNIQVPSGICCGVHEIFTLLECYTV